MRHYFDKFGGNLGTTGCVSFLFERKGVLEIEREDHDEDQVMEDALEAGASDFQADEDTFVIYTEPDDFSGVLDDLTAKGYAFETAEIQMVPNTYVKLPEDKQTSMQKLLDALEDNDDVQECLAQLGDARYGRRRGITHQKEAQNRKSRGFGLLFCMTEL